MECFFTHAQTGNVTRVQSATQWTASVHTLHMPKMLLWDIGVATSQKKGKPPPESKSKIDRCNLQRHVETKVGGKNTILFTDGAPAYPSVAERLQIQHEWVNHSKGQFTKTVTRQARGRPIVVAHTGTIDSCWKQCKNMIPSSLSSRHPMLLTYCKAWQWRFVHRNDNVAQITAKTLQKQM